MRTALPILVRVKVPSDRAWDDHFATISSGCAAMHTTRTPRVGSSSAMPPSSTPKQIEEARTYAKTWEKTHLLVGPAGALLVQVALLARVSQERQGRFAEAVHHEPCVNSQQTRQPTQTRCQAQPSQNEQVQRAHTTEPVDCTGSPKTGKRVGILSSAKIYRSTKLRLDQVIFVPVYLRRSEKNEHTQRWQTKAGNLRDEG